MTIYKKPGKTVFASAAKLGEVLDFPDRERGWGVTIDETNAIPPMEWFNDLQKVNDESIQYLLQYGVATKDSETEYPVNAITNENGELYICKKQHVNKPVSNSTYWEKIRKEASTTQAGVVELSSSVTSTDETKASTPKATKTAYDKAVQADNNANSRVSKAGDTMTGNLEINRGTYSGLILGVDSNNNKLIIENNDNALSNSNILSIILRKNGYSGDNHSIVSIPNKNGQVLLDTELSSSVESNNRWIPASSLAVKTAYDKANSAYAKAVQADNNANTRVSKNGDTMTGNLVIRRSNSDYSEIRLRNNANKDLYFGGLPDNDSSIGNIIYRDVASFKDISLIRIPKKNGTLALRDESVPVGSIQTMASDKRQKGYLKCDGGLYSTTTYAELFKEIGYTWGGSGSRFAVPNLTDKARFLRSSGNGLKVGAYQNDAIRNIIGHFGGEIAKDGTGLSGAFYTDGTVVAGRTLAQYDEDPKIIFDASRVVPTADENRPYSAVVAYWIKY